MLSTVRGGCPVMLCELILIMSNPFDHLSVSNALTMLMLLAIKIINGIAKRVGQIRYSNGSVVERVYPMTSDIPEDVKVLVPSAKAKVTKHFNPHTHDHIVNQEYMQYAHHFSNQMGL